MEDGSQNGVEEVQNDYNHENLLTRFVPLDRKTYYMDVRENNRGRYLKMTESSSKFRNTVLLPGPAVGVLQSVLGDAIKENYQSDVDADSLESNWVTIFSKSITNGQKKVYFDLMQNQRGRCINIAELNPNRPKCSILLLDSCWFQINKALKDIAEVLDVEQQEESEAEAAPYTIVDSTPPPRNTEATTAEASGETPSVVRLLSSKKMQLPLKRIFFDYKENELGRYCRITQVQRGNRDSIFLPEAMIPVFASVLNLLATDDITTEVDGATIVEPTQETEKYLALASKIISVDEERRYLLDLRENQRGQFLRVCEEKAEKAGYIFLPKECLSGVVGILSEFTAATNGSTST